MMFWVLLIGVLLGGAARHAWGDAMRVKDNDVAEREQQLLTTEIKRLRAQVANIIGSTPPKTCEVHGAENCVSCTTPRDAVHTGQNARAMTEAERLKKAA